LPCDKIKIIFTAAVSLKVDSELGADSLTNRCY